MTTAEALNSSIHWSLDGHFVLRKWFHSRQFFQCPLHFKACRWWNDSVLRLPRNSRLHAETVIAPAMGIGHWPEVPASSVCALSSQEKRGRRLVLRRGFRSSRASESLSDVVTKGGWVQETIEIVRAHQALLLPR